MANKKKTTRAHYSTRLDPLLAGAVQSKAHMKKLTKFEVGKRLDAAMAGAPAGRAPGESFAMRSMLSQTAESSIRALIEDDLVAVLVKTSDSKKVSDAVKGWNGASDEITASYASARVPRSKLRNLVKMREVDYVQAGVKLKPTCDMAHRSTGLLGATGMTRMVSQRGAGVLIGIIDSGIDTKHPAFQNADGSTRIVEYRDQNTGELFSAADIDGGASTSPDTVGHGTHVAGIAAGNGLRAGGAVTAFAGVAPEADLAIVKTSFNSADIGTAIRQIFDLAESRGQASVVNLSLGGHFGGHDGTGPAETVIDELSGAGRVVVASAGNEGEDAIHASTRLRPGEGDRFQANFRLETQIDEDTGDKFGRAVLQVWALREDADVDISVRSPLGDVIKAKRNDTVEQGGDDFFVRATDSDSVFSGDRSVTFTVIGLPPGAMTGWSLIVEDTSNSVEVGDVHAWILDSGTGVFTSGSTDSHLVGMPGTASSVITVAALASRNEWDSEDPDRPTVRLGGITVGDIASFSSPGPTRLGENKPDVAAPGQWLAATRSADSTTPPILLQPGGDYRMNQGTSMSAPYVTGAVALLLQTRPELNSTQVRRELIASCDKDGFTSVTWNPTWGHGKLNIPRLLG